MNYGQSTEAAGKEANSSGLSNTKSTAAALQKSVECINAAAVAASTFIECGIKNPYERPRLIHAEMGKAFKLMGTTADRASVEFGMDRKTVDSYMKERSWPEALPFSYEVDEFIKALREKVSKGEFRISKSDVRRLVEKIKRQASRSDAVRSFITAMQDAGIIKDVGRDSFKILSTTYIVADPKSAPTMVRRAKEALSFVRGASLVETFDHVSLQVPLGIEDARAIANGFEPRNITSKLEWFDAIEVQSKPSATSVFNTGMFVSFYQVPESGIGTALETLDHVVASASFRLVDFNLVPVWISAKRDILMDQRVSFSNCCEELSAPLRAAAQNTTGSKQALPYQLRISIFQNKN